MLKDGQGSVFKELLVERENTVMKKHHEKVMINIMSLNF